MATIHACKRRPNGLYVCMACEFVTDSLRDLARHVVAFQFVVR